MHYLKYCLLSLITVNGCLSASLISESYDEENNDEISSLFLQTDDRLADVLEYAQSFFSSEDQSNASSLQYQLTVSKSAVTLSPKKSWRDYNASVSKQEKQDISYIVNTLSKASIISLGTSRSSLKKAGDRIDHVHPLRFLMTVFCNEELKAGIAGIRSRGAWIWDEFVSGLTGSLGEEAQRNNLKSEFISDFARRVNIDVRQITPALEQGQWKTFINILIDQIPRQNDPNRYNI